jgi:hypothetical protein
MLLRLRQLTRLLVLLAFVGGGGGIPAIDAVLYHHANPADSPQGIHVEPLGASCHTDACLTGFSAIHGADRVHAIEGRLIAPVEVVSVLVDRSGDPRASRLPGPGLPRSPPAS